ncbi:carbon monoxide dehydrogenase [Ramlibacter henchirensis]|uniref:Carbon monoxide dehydrogenase n=1 Tax=Ramlibacter henchirensis TaxID=204072 RepID=A0A4Z0BSQ1_9BURK|nr:carbon monoxide dehydrogenase subunit G [Ramlibacter henchirensis]TFZ02326.1 carbon monoxide dehydrogenase [Ramlibacter henchirensis]
MDMQGSRQLAVDRQQAWEALNDPQVLAVCIPGCDRIEETGPGQYAIGMSVKVGPVSARFAGKIQLQDVQPPTSYTLKFEGQGGAAGFGKGQAQVRLEPREPGCELNYTASAQVGGKIAQVGQRLIDGVARSMAEDFFKRFEQELQRRYPAPAAASQETVAAGPASASARAPAVAERSGGGMPAWIWVVGAVVVAGVVYWLSR